MTRAIIDPIHHEYRRYQSLAEQTMARLEDDALRVVIGDGSVAMYALHLGGNLRSRFTGFLSTDGEKADRDRDGEFDLSRTRRPEIQAVWDQGWSCLHDAVDGLVDGDLARQITIRRQPLTVMEALARSLSHTAYHVGQIVLLGKIQLGDRWTSLSIPRGQSATYNANPTRERAHIRPVVTLVPAAADDLESLADLRAEAMRPSLEAVGRFDPVRVRERLRQSFDPACTRHIVADGIRVGFLVVRPRDDGPGWLLDHLYLRPGVQGHGLGGAVLALVFAEADAAGVELRVGALKGSPSNRFYQRHGFLPDGEGEWDCYYRRPAASGSGP